MLISFTATDTMLDTFNTSTGASATFTVWAGTPPSSPTGSTGGNTLLATIVCTTPSAWAAAGGDGTIALAATTADTNAAATGTPTFCRVQTSGAVGVHQYTAGVGSGEINFDQGVVATGTVTLTGLTVTNSAAA